MGGYGKWIGAVLGYLVGRGLLGAVVGFVLGHLFDRATAARGPAANASEALRTQFFTTSFEVMGHVAKADGRVTELEIRAARETMRRFGLGERDTQRAIELFTAGKATDYPLEERVQELRGHAAGRPDLCRAFLLVQIDAALFGGGLTAASRAVLLRVAGALSIGAAEFAAMEAMLRMRGAAGAAGAAGAGQGSTGYEPARDRLADAYQLLGVAAATSDADVTLAYRRLMSQNHPDKLVANGLPQSMVGAAHERTRQILEAFDTIKRARGMK